jgi:hypothetical protein
LKGLRLNKWKKDWKRINKEIKNDPEVQVQSQEKSYTCRSISHLRSKVYFWYN